MHGTGHGVGSFLNVHEGPCGILPRERPGEIGLGENMILSNEPGYYEPGTRKQIETRIQYNTSAILVLLVGCRLYSRGLGQLRIVVVPTVVVSGCTVVPTVVVVRGLFVYRTVEYNIVLH